MVFQVIKIDVMMDKTMKEGSKGPNILRGDMGHLAAMSTSPLRAPQ